jgi:hypothetical protein
VQSGFSVPITNIAGPGNVIDLPAGNNISNPSINPIGFHSGCLLSGEPMPSWYIFKICNSGMFEFIVGASINQYQQAGYYDWALWKYSPTTCSKILNNQLAPLRCNWNASQAGGTGICDTLSLPMSGVNGNYEPPLTVSAGDSLIICINNYSGVNYIIDFISVGTSSINCSFITSLPSNKIEKRKFAFYNRDLNKIELTDTSIETIIIQDALGKEVYKTNIEESTLVECSNFNKGLYFVTFVFGTGSKTTEKLLID